MIIFPILLLFVLGIYFFMKQPSFGALPAGERLEKIVASPHYKRGQFQNLSYTPNLAEGVSYYTVMRKFFFAKSKRSKPAAALPSRKADLKQLNPDDNILVWFGHSSYFMQLDGKSMLVDPVFSGAASPVKFTTRSFPGTDVYSAEDMPPIDYLFITHDHWDHLDYETITKLKPNIKKIITGLGVGAHLERWGFDKSILIEKDWNEHASLDDGFQVTTASGRHFSGRGFKRNSSLWSAFILRTPTLNIFIGGDSGYDHHFATIGKQYGPFHLAILENGQYNPYWKYIHMMPEEVVQAAEDLRAKKLLPVHWGKFSLSLHAWDEPILRVTAEASRKGMPVLHPMIGEVVYLDDNMKQVRWWEGIL